ncbi:MAG: fused MFS/spermidine synthase [Caldilineae bacterium]|nr:fused MFS/spermidine synthase [Caldilineae bacterium]
MAADREPAAVMGVEDAVRISSTVDPVGMEQAAGRRWSWQPYAIVFVSSACIMILELVAGRIVAPYVGVSLYTWTTIIGVVLAGISLGNYLGGRLADRWPSTRLLGLLFLAAGMTSFIVLTVDRLGVRLPPGSIVIQIVVLVTALFFIPCAILGAISPVVAKLAVRDLATTGTTVGKIYAAGTLGSIVGTFATGFVLISRFGTHAIVWGVGLTLIAMGALFLLRRKTVALVLAAVIVAGGLSLAWWQGWSHGPCALETNYFCIKVREEDRNGERVRVLVLDRLVHSFTSMDDPTKLVYGYEQMYAEATAYRAADKADLRALFIGGGGYTFPKYMAAIYPDSELEVIEIDPGVTRIAYDLLGVPADSAIVTRNEDARMVLSGQPDRPFDLIMGDAFNDYSVPYHLTTVEFNELVARWLAPGGLYMVNIIDGPRGDFVRAFANTLQQTFPHVYVAPTIDAWRSSPRSTFVLIASDEPLDVGRLADIDAGDGLALLARQLLDDADLAALLAEHPLLTLTDQFAPVDQMLAPTFRNEVPRQ